MTTHYSESDIADVMKEIQQRLEKIKQSKRVNHYKDIFIVKSKNSVPALVLVGKKRGIRTHVLLPKRTTKRSVIFIQDRMLDNNINIYSTNFRDFHGTNGYWITIENDDDIDKIRRIIKTTNIYLDPAWKV